MKKTIELSKDERRTIEQVKEHYEIEKQLASRLLNSTREERQYLYTALYNELFNRVSHHPQLLIKSDPDATGWIVAQRMQLLSHFLKPNLTYLEVGSGDCSLAFEVTKYVKKVYAVDVSTEITKYSTFPQNFELVISDGCSIPNADNSIDIVYSHQLMEHLHPDDAIEQLQHIYRVLAPGGIYICITPNQLSGPHDISQYFDEIASGFHLQEYKLTELYNLFRRVGFSEVSLYKSYKTLHLKIPLFFLTVFLFRRIELAISILPFSLRRKIAGMPLLFRGMTIIGKK